MNWKVGEQVNVSKYTVQHSLNGTEFKNVCEIIATSFKDYHCLVTAEKDRQNYYRVLQTDKDGKSSYSKIVSLNYQQLSAVTIQPNPVLAEMRVSGLEKYEMYAIVDVTGKVVMKEKIKDASNAINVAHLLPGLYLLKLEGREGNQSLKFIKK